MQNQYNVLIDVVGAFLVGAILLTERRQARHGDAFNTRLLHSLMLCCTLEFLLDVPGLLLDGCVFFGARSLLWILDSAYWAMQIVYCWLWLLFADTWAYGAREHFRGRDVVFLLPMVLELLLIAVNPLTGWIFQIDRQNVYARGNFYLWNMLPYGIYIVAALVVTIHGCRKNEDPVRRKRGLSLVTYMFLPICGVFFDMFIYGISWVWPMVALSLLLTYLDVQQQAISAERLAAVKTQAELTESRMAVMLSQIQPHFLYNALSSITELCDEDPKTAKRATVEFASFLRGNMDSLTVDKPIGFDLELEHTKHYLALEMLRFPGKLRVVYDIGTTMFRLPTLSLQPIVENAVRYGVTKRREGGTVCISAHEADAGFLVTVSDDGVGFDPAQKHEDGRTHIGISNVRDRLARMSGGTLHIQSTPGVGTIAVITIPKGEKA